MRLTIIAVFTYSFIFPINLPTDTLRQRKIQSRPFSEFPELSNLTRDPSDLIGRWNVLGDYYSSYFKISSDSNQTIANPGQFHGYVPLDEGVSLATPSDTIELNYAYIDSGVISLFSSNMGGSSSYTPSRTLVMSNTPITKHDRLININPGFFPQTSYQNYYQDLLDVYQSDTYPRYLYTATFMQVSFFGVFVIPVHFLHIWYDEYTVEYYMGPLQPPNTPNDTTTVLYGNYVDYAQKRAQFDSVVVGIPIGAFNQTQSDTIELMFDGNLEPDSILIPSNSLVNALDYYMLRPSIIIDQNADYITWIFDEDYTGNQISTYININWNNEIYSNRDTIPLSWEIIEDSVLIIFDQEDSLFMSYGLISDTLYFGGDFIFCDQGVCNDSIPSFSPLDTLDIDWFENLTGLSSINHASTDIGIAIKTIINNAHIILSPSNQTVFSTYSVGNSSHGLQFFSAGLDSLEWFVDEPIESWISIDTLSGILAPDSMQTLTFTINGEALASDSEYPIDIIIQSNDIDNPVTVVPITIQVNPPDLYMVGLNNNSFTIAEDDTLETIFYVIGPQGNTTFSISGDTSSITGHAVIDDEYVPNSVSNYSLKATLFVIPDHNWYGQATIYVTADNEYDYADTDTLTIEVTSVYDQILEPQMVFPPNGHTIYFETMTDSISFVWNSAGYPDFETGPGFEYRLRIVQSNEIGNIPYNYTDLTDTTFTFFPDSSTYAGQNNNYIWSLYTTEENLPEVLSGQGGVFFVILPAMNIESNEIPNEFMLYNAFPNPFNPSTTIRFDLPEDSFVTINVYDMVGRHVKTLLNNKMSAGRKSIVWDSTNNFDQPVSTGTYFYTIKTGEYSQTKKMVYLK